MINVLLYILEQCSQLLKCGIFNLYHIQSTLWLLTSTPNVLNVATMWQTQWLARNHHPQWEMIALSVLMGKLFFFLEINKEEIPWGILLAMGVP